MVQVISFNALGLLAVEIYFQVGMWAKRHWCKWLVLTYNLHHSQSEPEPPFIGKVCWVSLSLNPTYHSCQNPKSKIP